jgi:hypothetical protein
MLPELYTFFEKFAGVSFNFDDLYEVIDGYTAFIEPYLWQTCINEIIDGLEEAMNVVEQFGDDLNDDMPDKSDAKKLIATDVIGHLVKNVNDIKKILNIERTDINDYDDLEMHIYTLGNLIKMLIDNSLDDILKQQLFEEYLTDDDEDDNPFETVLNIHRNDMASMSFIVTSIREDYFASLDEDTE